MQSTAIDDGAGEVMQLLVQRVVPPGVAALGSPQLQSTTSLVRACLCLYALPRLQVRYVGTPSCRKRTMKNGNINASGGALTKRESHHYKPAGSGWLGLTALAINF
jgi:hypothetical protein